MSSQLRGFEEGICTSKTDNSNISRTWINPKIKKGQSIGFVTSFLVILALVFVGCDHLNNKSVIEDLLATHHTELPSSELSTPLKVEVLTTNSPSIASVVTDYQDYSPGDTAIITAKGFEPGEAVQFLVLHIDGKPNTGNGHEPWIVVDGSEDDMDGEVNGIIVTSWYVDPDDSLNSRFELTAEGLSSGLVATHHFEDDVAIPTSVSANYDPVTDILTVDVEWEWNDPNDKALGVAVFADLDGDGMTPTFTDMPETWTVTNLLPAPLVASDEFLGQLATSSVEGTATSTLPFSDDTDTGIASGIGIFTPSTPRVLFPYGLADGDDALLAAHGGFTVTYTNVTIAPTSLCIILYDIHTGNNQTTIDDENDRHSPVSANNLTTAPDYNNDNSVEDGFSENVSCTDPRSGISQVDLALDKDVDNSTPAVGANVVFTITVTNESSDSSSTGFTVEDILPAGFTYVSDNGVMGNDYDDGTGIWTYDGSVVGNLSPMASTSIEITATVNAMGPYENYAQIESDEQLDPDSTPGDDSTDQDDDDSVTVTPQEEADLNLIKTVSDATPNVGDQITFTITVENDGPNEATNVQVVDSIPVGFSYVSDNGGGNTSEMGGVVTWDIASIPNGNSVSLIITVDILAPTNTPGEYQNIAKVTASDQADPDSDPNNNADNNPGGGIGSEENDGSQDPNDDDDGDDATIVPQEADLNLIKTVSDATPNVGDQITFTITVENDGPDEATTVQVVDSIPAGLSYVGDNGGGATSEMGGVVTWNIPSIPNGNSVSLIITVDVLAPTNTPDEYQNIAEVTASDQYDPDSEPDNGADNDPGGGIGSEDDDDSQDPDDDDDGDDATIVPQEADINLIKTVSDDTPNVGDQITFTITVENDGPNEATNVQVVDSIPVGFSYVGDNGGGATSEMGGVVTWDIPSIPNGNSVSLIITVDVLAPTNSPGEYQNLAEVTESDQFDPDSEPDNGADNDPGGGVGSEDDDGSQDPNDDDDGDDASVTPQEADLALSKVVSDATPNVGDVVTFTITVINGGPDAASGVAVGDVVPNGFGNIENISDPGSGQGVLMGSTITWSNINIPFPGVINLSFDATVLTPGPGISYNNHAEVTLSDQYDPDSDPDPSPDDDPPGEDDEDDESLVPQQADLALSKSVDNPTPNVGDIVTFTITVINGGPDGASGVSVGDVVPNGYGNIQNISDPGSGPGVLMGDTIRWSNISIPFPGMVNLTFEAEVLPPLMGVDYLNHAEVTDSDQFDPDSDPDPIPDDDPPGEDDEDNESVTPQEADLRLEKSVDDTNPNVGNVVTFTITVTNDGPDAATGVGVGDVIPNGFGNIMNISNGGILMGSVISWSGLNIPFPGSIMLTFEAEVLPPLMGVEYDNHAEVTESDQHDPDSDPDPDPDDDDPMEDDEDDEELTPQVADLSMEKTVDDNMPEVGDTVTFTITVTNDGPDPATNVGVGDVVPNGFGDIMNISHGGMLMGSTIQWTGLNIPFPGSIMLTFEAEVLPPAPGITYNNHAEVTDSDQHDPDSDPDPDPDDDDPVEDDEDDEEVTPPLVYADLSLIKQVDDGTPEVGDTVTFSISVTNDGPLDATGVSVKDSIPNGYSNIGNISHGGMLIGDIITWDNLNIPNGVTLVLTFDAEVIPLDVFISYVNIAEVTASDQMDPDSNPGNGADSSPGGGIGSEDPDGTQDPNDEDDGDDATVRIDDCDGHPWIFWIGPDEGEWNEDPLYWSGFYIPTECDMVKIHNGAKVTVKDGEVANAFTLEIMLGSELIVEQGAELNVTADH